MPNVSNYTQTLLMQNKYFGVQNTFYQKRVLWTLQRSPPFEQTKHFGYVSVPILAQMAQISVDDILYDGLYISLHDSSDHSLID